MSVSQVEKFVNEAIALNYCWDRISLFGGEPTLHPQFFEIVDALKPYKAFNPDCYIDLVTNGAGHKVKSVLARLPNWVKVQNSEKTEGKESYPFGTYNIAPVDTVGFRFFSDYSKGCRIIESCFGLGLSMFGYYPCSPCMHVDRVFGFNIGIKQLSSVTDGALRAQMAILCRYCGWFKHPDLSTTVVEKISRSWQKVYAEYKRQKPVLSRY
jgi:hypothetical protein